MSHVQARRFLEIFGGSNLITRTFWQNLANFVCTVSNRRFCLHCSFVRRNSTFDAYIYIFFFGVKPFRKQAYGILEK